MKSEKTIKVGIIQQANGESIADNRCRLMMKIRTLAAQGAQLVVLQERLFILLPSGIDR